MEIDTTNSGLQPKTIKEYPVKSDDNNDEIKISSTLRRKICFTQNKKIAIAELILTALIFLLVLTGVSFKICYQMIFNSVSDRPENSTVAKARVMKSPKLEQLDTRTKHYDNDAGNDTLSNLDFQTISTTAYTFLAGLNTSTKSNSINQPSTEYAFQAREKEHMEPSVCDNFKLTSNGLVLQYMPELIGEYRLEHMISIENETLAYINDDTGFIMVQSTEIYLDKRKNPLLNQNLTNIWSIKDSLSNQVLSFNGYCNDTKFPINNVCQHGWYVYVDDFTWGQKAHPWQLDISASVLCNTPHHTVTTLPTDSICKELELRPTTTFVEPVLRQFIGEYELTDSIHRNRVVYKGINSSNALFSDKDKSGKRIWIFANNNLMGITTSESFSRALKIHDIQGSVVTPFCPDVEYPANGKCAYDWYYMPMVLFARPNQRTLNVQIRGTVQCTKY